MTDDDVHLYARFLRRHGLRAKVMQLLEKHAVGVDGRCLTCPAGEASSGRMRGPCILLRAAEEALRLPGPTTARPVRG